jgi:hypothetical protein
MEPKRDEYTSPQQWMAANLEDPSPEVKQAIILLWRDLYKLINHWTLRAENWEKGFNRRTADLELLKSRMKT